MIVVLVVPVMAADRFPTRTPSLRGVGRGRGRTADSLEKTAPAAWWTAARALTCLTTEPLTPLLTLEAGRAENLFSQPDHCPTDIDKNFGFQIRRYQNTKGEFPERSKGLDCKSSGIAFAGSNPALPIPIRLTSA